MKDLTPKQHTIGLALFAILTFTLASYQETNGSTTTFPTETPTLGLFL